MVCALLKSVGQAVPAGFDCADIAENTVHCHVDQDHSNSESLCKLKVEY